MIKLIKVDITNHLAKGPPHAPVAGLKGEQIPLHRIGPLYIGHSRLERTVIYGIRKRTATQITIKACDNQAIIRKVTKDTKGQIVSIHGLSSTGKWIQKQEGKPYDPDCILPITQHPDTETVA